MTTPDTKQQLAEAIRRRRADFKAPPFWIAGYEAVQEKLASLERAETRAIGRSAGGRPIHAVSYGEVESIDRISTRSAAQLHGCPTDFFDPEKRTRPAVLLVGSIHGSETEGAVTCLNLAHLLENGTDLRGRKWDALRDLAEDMRIALVPLAQPDGNVRSAVHGLPGDGGDLVLGTPRKADAPGFDIARWSRQRPMPRESVKVMGTYFNDDGVDINTDDFFSPAMAPESHALLDLARTETPDCVLVMHSHDLGPWISMPRAYVPPRCQWHSAQIRALVAERHRREGLHPKAPPVARGDAGNCFDLPTALHHVSGAVPLSFEFPHFLMPTHTPDQVLDIGLTMLEEVLRYVQTCGYRQGAVSFNRDHGLREQP